MKTRADIHTHFSLKADSPEVRREKCLFKRVSVRLGAEA